MARLADQRFTYSYRGYQAEIIMRPGRGKISRREYFSLLLFRLYQYTWLFSPPSLVSQVRIARRWELWGWVGASRPRYSVLITTGWMDNLRFYGFFLILLSHIRNMGRRLNKAVCNGTATCLVHILHYQMRES